MTRLRIHFAKRGSLCFVPHVEMPPLLCRCAHRAGLRLQFTEGMSPHPHVTLGPPLPIGVVGLEEPAEMWFENWSPERLDVWRRVTPDGLSIVRAEVIREGRALSKLCQASRVLLFPREKGVLAEYGQVLREALGDETLLALTENSEGFLDISLPDPNRYGPGALVKALVGGGCIEGWADLFMARLAVGTWDGERVVPLQGR